jgi:hypothetical protein
MRILVTGLTFLSKVVGMKSLVVSLVLIFVGTGWLLTTLGIAPNIDWIWTLLLAVMGISAFVVSGFDKISLMVGPFFLCASLLSVLRQSGTLKIDTEVPILVILLGCLLLIARMPRIPTPKWLEGVKLQAVDPANATKNY